MEQTATRVLAIREFNQADDPVSVPELVSSVAADASRPVAVSRDFRFAANPPLGRRHASGLAMNPGISKADPTRDNRQNDAVAIRAFGRYWSTLCLLMTKGVLPWRVVVIWLMTLSMICFLNTLRALVRTGTRHLVRLATV